DERTKGPSRTPRLSHFGRERARRRPLAVNQMTEAERYCESGNPNETGSHRILGERHGRHLLPLLHPTLRDRRFAGVLFVCPVSNKVSARAALFGLSRGC